MRKYLFLRFVCLVTTFGAPLVLATSFDAPKRFVEDSMHPKYSFTTDWTAPVYVGLIRKTSDIGTVGRPPSSMVEFQKTLRGPAIEGSRNVIWTRGVSAVTGSAPVCTNNPDGTQLSCKAALHEPRLVEKISPPQVGDKVILAAMTLDREQSTASRDAAIPGVFDRVKSENAVVARNTRASAAHSCAKARYCSSVKSSWW